MSRDTAIEMMILAAGWGFAVMIQSLLNIVMASYISQHWITDGFIASQGSWWAGFYTILRDEITVGMLIGLLIGVCIYRLAKSRIEIECVLYGSLIIAVFLGLFLYVTGKWTITALGYLILFIECAPLCAVLWKGFYIWVDWVNKRNEVKEVKADPKPIAPAKVVIDEPKEPKKEDKPAGESSQPPKEPPAEPAQKSFWKID